MRSVLVNQIVLIARIIGCIALLFLGACHRANHYIIEQDAPKLPCKVNGTCDATIDISIDRFNKRGIKIITEGEDFLIAIPAAALFADQSPRFIWASYSLLNDVARFLKQFRKTAITITSFSSRYISNKREHALTLARARVVSEYLWSQGVDSRFIFTQGVGSDKPIVGMQGGDKTANARIEITFRNAL